MELVFRYGRPRNHKADRAIVVRDIFFNADTQRPGRLG